MMLLWISCLLVGSISCVPAGKKYSSDPAGPGFRWQPSYGHLSRGRGVSSDPGHSSSLPPWSEPIYGSASVFPQDGVSRPGSYNVAGEHDVGYGSFRGGYDSSAPAGGYGGGFRGGYGGYASAAPVGGYGGGYANSASGPVGGGSSRFAPASKDEVDRPVFSDVSDLEPIASFSSHSSYKRGKAMLVRTRSFPEPVPVIPVSRRTSEASSTQSPAKVPAKGRL